MDLYKIVQYEITEIEEENIISKYDTNIESISPEELEESDMKFIIEKGYYVFYKMDGGFVVIDNDTVLKRGNQVDDYFYELSILVKQIVREKRLNELI